MRKIGIILNPHAKVNRKRRIDPVKIYKELGGNNVDVRATENLDEVMAVAEDYKRQKISYLGISGGDGTIHHVISRFICVYKSEDIPPIVILKDGTMNNISKSIKLKGNGSQILMRLIRAIDHGRDINIIKRDTIKVEDKYCFLFGMALATNFISEYNEGEDRGPGKAIKLLLKGVLGGIFNQDNSLFKRLRITAIIDGKELCFNDFLGILAGTIENIGLGFRPLASACKKDNTFHLIATGMKPLDLVLRLNRFKNGRPLKHPMHFDDIVQNMRIICPNRFNYLMDGDIYEAEDELNVGVGLQVGLVYI